MTNHQPNDLSHLSNEEFNLLCPQGEHAPGPAMTDFRALCEEIDALLNDIASTHPNLSENGVKVINDLSDRARAALAEQPVWPTEEELNALWIEQYGYTGHSPAMSLLEFKDAARAVLARWGQP